ncbi:hypothetical protein K466DRAFT_583209 [Polyporus arcularius HHB13444]|uniref:Uncharacterized protein n=1 Tax=Polyporus arcularius HHB13444 TaxID=1314778 RepID=A0A5C3PMH5_9APHY|nr:hypothetical protein K466DRAFT_583209 [Polyporus arcularius HHB13444]
MHTSSKLAGLYQHLARVTLIQPSAWSTSSSASSSSCAQHPLDIITLPPRTSHRWPPSPLMKDQKRERCRLSSSSRLPAAPRCSSPSYSDFASSLARNAASGRARPITSMFTPTHPLADRR